MEEKVINGELSRLEILADKSGKTVEEYLTGLEESFEVDYKNKVAEDHSIGSQCENSSNTFDPTGTEFLKGIWGK